MDTVLDRMFADLAETDIDRDSVGVEGDAFELVLGDAEPDFEGDKEA